MRTLMKLYYAAVLCAFVILVRYNVYNHWGILGADHRLRHIVIKTVPVQVPCLRVSPSEDLDLPMLYVITPTYWRPEQIAELTRLSHTLMLVPNLTWLVIEDAYQANDLVEDVLRKSGLRYHYALAPMPLRYKYKLKRSKPKGVANRNEGLAWIRVNAVSGVFYFADDDNTYDLELFHEIRSTKKVSMFPVGLVTEAGVSSPVVRDGVFAGFYDGWLGKRKFAVDMAGLAVSVEFLLQRPLARMPFKPGFEEDGFLKSLAPFEPEEIELLAANCTKILVWHTRTVQNGLALPLGLERPKYEGTNIVKLKRLVDWELRG